MEDDQIGRRPKWKTTKMEDDQNGRQPKWKMPKGLESRIINSRPTSKDNHTKWPVLYPRCARFFLRVPLESKLGLKLTYFSNFAMEMYQLLIVY